MRFDVAYFTQSLEGSSFYESNRRRCETRQYKFLNMFYESDYNIKL